MGDGEGVVEIEDREDEANEFTQCDDQGNDEGGALCRENEDSSDTDVLSDAVADNIEPHLRNGQSVH